MRTVIFSLLLCVVVGSAVGQTGGRGVYQFLEVPVSARVAALGGAGIVTPDFRDVNLTMDNPALLNEQMNNHLALNFVDYIADVKYGQLQYVQHTGIGTFSGGLKYLSYGDFVETDNGGNVLGDFTLSDYAFVIGYGNNTDSAWYYGGNLKFIYSDFRPYNSFGMAADFSLMRYWWDKDMSLALMISNVGAEILTYNRANNVNREPLPYDLQLGFSKRFEHVPFRFSLHLHDLTKWDLTYVDSTEITPSIDPSQQDQKVGAGFLEKAARHCTFGGEFYLTENFHLRMGFNYQRRRELVVVQKNGVVGFSFGVGFRVSRFYISYGRANYHLAGGSNHFSITTNLSSFFGNASKTVVID